MVVFIAGAAALAVVLFCRPTIADGRVIEADLLADLRKAGVVSMSCDREIPIGVAGAQFTCVATLGDGATQTAEFVMHRAGNYTWTMTGQSGPGRARIPPSGDPWAN